MRGLLELASGGPRQRGLLSRESESLIPVIPVVCEYGWEVQLRAILVFSVYLAKNFVTNRPSAQEDGSI